MKRDPLMIIERILAELERGKACSMNELAKQTKLHYVTVRRYVQIIERVREEPEIEVIRTRHSVIVRVVRHINHKEEG
ncbi:MAG: hypothetical protein HY369_02420 [Candidatus Aenigmarchaeota archaeon]|nr:hypothetical protein [Candidatus Aenigmarchaeota archaeon]